MQRRCFGRLDQSWKETFRANKLTSLNLGQVEWIDTNIFNLWQNNDSYQDTGSAIYPMLANFGASLSNASNDVCILDIRFIVYLKALIEEGREEVVSDCFHCNNQGEIAITEDEVDNYLNQHKSERLQ